MRGVVKLGASPVRRVDPATIARQVLMKAAVRGEAGGGGGGCKTGGITCKTGGSCNNSTNEMYSCQNSWCSSVITSPVRRVDLATVV